MSTILTLLPAYGEKLGRNALETLTRARQLAAERDAELTALLLGSHAGDLADDAARYGAARIFTALPDLSAHLNEPVLAAAEAAASEVDPALVLMPGTEAMKDVLGALAARLDGAALADVSEIEWPETSRVEAVRPVLAAKYLARVEAEGEPILVSIRSGSYEAEPAPADGVETTALDVGADAARAVLREVRGGSGGVDLSEARVVVAAGRGIKDESGRELIEQLAEKLGAAIGASRAVVENGLFPASTQIGQTGKVVTPDLYIAVGISGAIQHVAGMQDSRVIVAVNKDADAPIFDVASYGIVGDLFEVLPRLIDELDRVNA